MNKKLSVLIIFLMMSYISFSQKSKNKYLTPILSVNTLTGETMYTWSLSDARTMAKKIVKADSCETYSSILEDKIDLLNLKNNLDSIVIQKDNAIIAQKDSIITELNQKNSNYIIEVKECLKTVDDKDKFIKKRKRIEQLKTIAIISEAVIILAIIIF